MHEMIIAAYTDTISGGCSTDAHRAAMDQLRSRMSDQDILTHLPDIMRAVTKSIADDLSDEYYNIRTQYDDLERERDSLEDDVDALERKLDQAESELDDAQSEVERLTALLGETK